MKRLCAPTRKPVRVAPVRPSAAITSRYQKRLDTEIARMAASVSAAVLRLYRIKPPELAQDESPAAAMRALMGRLASEWTKRFDELAQTAGRKFARDAAGHANKQFAANLRKAGFTVRMDPTRVTNDLQQAAITENVSLIRSIPSEYFTQIQSMVTASAQVGGDLGALSGGLQKQFGVTARRAAIISRDQQAKIVAGITKARQTELGIESAKWLHSSAGKIPRESHVKFSRGQLGGPIYNIKEGALIDGERIWPGQLINCFPGDMIVNPVGMRKLWRAPFHGPMIHFYVGADLLKGTANHPILTPCGWRPIGLLNDGDEIVCMTDQDADVVANEKNQLKTTFAQLFESFASIFGYVSREARCFDFYGDIPHGEVDEITLPEWYLPTNLNADLLQNFREFEFAKADGGILGAGRGGEDHVVGACAAGFASDLLACSNVGIVKTHDVGCAAIPHDALSIQDISHIAGRMSGEPESDANGSRAHSLPDIHIHDLSGERVPVSSFIDGYAAGAEFFAQLVGVTPNSSSGSFKVGAGSYEVRRLSNKSVRDFSGHVYTTETCSGYYSVGAAHVQAKNCRCVSISIVMPA